METVIKAIGHFSHWNLRRTSSCLIRGIHASGTVFFNLSPILNAEPPKKKKRVDPVIEKKREDRRKRKIEKGIRKLEKSSAKLKPLEEIDVTPKFRREIPPRLRNVAPLTYEEMAYRKDVEKRWCRYQSQLHRRDISMFERMLAAQNDALQALREESEELYNKAVEVDPDLIPFEMTGPVNTPPILNYDPPEGDYVDTTKKWK